MENNHPYVSKYSIKMTLSTTVFESLHTFSVHTLWKSHEARKCWQPHVTGKNRDREKW